MNSRRANPPSVSRPCSLKPNPRTSLPLRLIWFLAIVVITCLSCGRNSAKPESQAPNPEQTRAKAEAGDPGSQRQMGDLFAKGLGVEQDYKQAAKWYKVAADQRDAAAQSSLGELYEAGQGVPRDQAEAGRLYRQAAEAGYAPAQYNLAVLLAFGRGVPMDVAEALKWYREAAKQGDSLAQFNLGMRYFEGKGVSKDPVEAYQWLSLAAAQDMPDAANALSQLKQSLSRDQLAEAKRRLEAIARKQ